MLFYENFGIMLIFITYRDRGLVTTNMHAQQHPPSWKQLILEEGSICFNFEVINMVLKYNKYLSLIDMVK